MTKPTFLKTRYQIFKIFAILFLFLLQNTLISQVTLTPIGNYRTGIYADGAAEIVAHDPLTQRLFVVNVAQQRIDALDISNASNPALAFFIDMSPYGSQANSVDVHNGVLAAAVENDSTQLPGSVVFFDTDGNYLNQVPSGPLPDMITFTKDGDYILVANEGEPNADYTHDPEGSVSVIDMRNGVGNATARIANFHAFNSMTLDPSIRIFGPGATVAQDLEPEYITTSGNRAFVTCQENNAIAVVNIARAKVVALHGLGFKDYNTPHNGIDASNRDSKIRIRKWPALGMYQPDAIDIFKTNGGKYLVTANEGDSREYLGVPGFVGETRVEDVTLDSLAFPNAAYLQRERNLGRLKMTITNGDTDGDGDFDEIYSYGARSISIWDTDGNLVSDTGDELERITATFETANFNSDDEENGSFDDRSDDKGPEPEGVVVGVVEGHPFAFVGLERVGGIVVYNISDAANPYFVQYINTRDFNGDPLNDTAGDMSPEGMIFIKSPDSPTGKPLLVVSYEISGSTSIFEITHNDNTRSLEADRSAALTADRFHLEQNYPNPFNPSTEIRFQLPQESNVELTIYNSLGQKVRNLASGYFESGAHTVQWNGKDNLGNPAASGFYFYKIVTDAHIEVKKMHLLK